MLGLRHFLRRLYLILWGLVDKSVKNLHEIVFSVFGLYERLPTFLVS